MVLSRLRAALSRPYLPFPRTGRPFARLSRAAVPGRLRISAAETDTGFGFEPVDPSDFPRRVQACEVLARTPNGFPLLAPVPGIADYEPDSHCFLLKTEGAVRLGGAGESDPNPNSAHSFEALRAAAEPEARRAAWLDALQAGALPVLEQRGLSLAAGFQSLFDAVGQAGTEAQVVITLRDGTGGIGWPAIFSERSTELESLLALLADLHPGVRVLPLDRGPSGAAHYGATLPEVVVRRLRASWPGFAPLDPQRSLIEQGILFLGPATLFALIEWLFRGQPFVDRLSTVLLPGTATAKSPLFRLINGYSLGQLFQEKVPARFHVGDSPNYRIVQGSRFAGTARTPAAELSGELNIFEPAVFEIVRGALPDQRPAPRPCTACRACDRVCPVQAGPFALLAGGRFGAERCLECGLCEAACESVIPLSESISVARARVGLPVRRPAARAARVNDTGPADAEVGAD